MLKYTDKNIIMSAEKASTTPETPEPSLSQLQSANVSKRNFKRLKVSESDLNNYAAKLKIQEKININDNQSVFNFVHALQAKIIEHPIVTESFKGRLKLLSDNKFGPETLRALYLVLTKSETDNLKTKLDGILNKPVKREDPVRSAEVKTTATQEAPFTYHSPEIDPQWEFSKYYSPEKDPVPTRTSCNVKSGEPLWTLGSSSGYNEQKHTGFGSIGAIGTNPTSFYKVLTQVIWPDIERQGVKPPAKVILLGLGTNGLTSSKNREKIDKSVADNLAGYQHIINFLNSKGIAEVKIATLNPYGKKIEAINKFNEIIRRNPDLCVDTNRAITAEDGKSFKPGYNSDRLHLSKKGHQAFAAVVQAEAQKQKGPQA